MSVYYDFYPAAKVGNKYKIIGNYIMKDSGYTLYPVLSRSSSFINREDFYFRQLSLDEISDEDMECLTTRGWFDEDGEPQSIAYLITMDELEKLAGDGVVRGYVELDTLDGIVQSNYDPEWLFNLLVLTPERVAEMAPEERQQYGHVAILDNASTEYIASILLETINNLRYADFWDGDLYLIMTWS